MVGKYSLKRDSQQVPGVAVAQRTICSLYPGLVSLHRTEMPGDILMWTPRTFKMFSSTSKLPKTCQSHPKRSCVYICKDTSSKCNIHNKWGISTEFYVQHFPLGFTCSLSAVWIYSGPFPYQIPKCSWPLIISFIWVTSRQWQKGTKKFNPVSTTWSSIAILPSTPYPAATLPHQSNTSSLQLVSHCTYLVKLQIRSLWGVIGNVPSSIYIEMVLEGIRGI